MTKHKNKFDHSRPIRFVLLGLAALGVLLAELLYGADIKLLSPQGHIAQEQLNLILISAGLLLLIGVPALFFFYYFAWKYRETNKKAKYEPNVRHGKLFTFGIWALPSIFALVLALVMWPATHRLEPNDPITANAKPITVQVVAMRWKWLFIYPEQNVATVNYVQVPVGTPVHFELTADEVPMSSFWVPHLGGQLYAMTGHVNRLNLIADTPGDYSGGTAEINGAGFAGMKFIVRAGSQSDFDRWVRTVRYSSDPLDSREYENLLKPSESNPSAFYSPAQAGLYDKVLMKYMGSHGHADAENDTDKQPDNHHHMEHE